MANRSMQIRRRRALRRGRGRGRVASFALGLFIFLTISTSGVVLAGLGVYMYFAKDLPSPDLVAQRQIARSTKIYDRHDRLLYEIFDPEGGRRTTVPLSQISPFLISATIATEDADFYSNPGINVRGLLRAVAGTILGDEQGGGGSSITQQLVKNVLIPEEERNQRLLSRKIKEGILALELTRRYPKDQILEWYLNEIFYGNLSYGVEAAARSYFGKSAAKLDLAESAMLVGLPQAPALYSPLTNPKRAKARQADVLDLMVRHGFISLVEAEKAKEERLQYVSQRFTIDAPHFVVYVREVLERKYGTEAVYRGGLRVITTLDFDLQQEAQAIVTERIERLAQTNNAHNAALVALKPETGEVLAMVGSMDYFDPTIDGQVNMALAERQPGSAFKPFTYATAFERGYAPASMMLDIPTSFPSDWGPPYTPQNVDRTFWGPITIREALANSRNLPAVRLLKDIGVPDVVVTAHRMGIATLTGQSYGLALTLGGGEVTLLDMAFAHAAFANGGMMRGQPVTLAERQPGMRELEPVVIIRVEDGEGRVLEEFSGPEEREVISPQVAYLINDVLSDNQARARTFGVNSGMTLNGRPSASKTGTTSDFVDNWIIGYTPDLVTGVWVGNADYTPMYNSYGSTSATPIWKAFMEKALAGTEPHPFAIPPGLVKVWVCVPSGLLPTGRCPRVKEELFIQGKEPQRADNIYQVFKIDRTTGLLATPETPPENVEEKVFMVLPADADDWVRMAGIPQPPTEYSPPPSSDVSLSWPQAGSFVRGVVGVQGAAEGDGFTSYSLEYGAGLTPGSWTLIGSVVEEPRNGTLGQFDTSGLEGLYSLRLTVLNQQRGLLRVVVPVTVDNTPPTGGLTYPSAGAKFTLVPGSFEEIALQASAKDNLGIDRVEFFVDGQSLGTSSVLPYTRSWRLERGEHTIHLVLYDKAGNSHQTAPVAITVG